MLCEKCGKEYFENIPLLSYSQICMGCVGEPTPAELNSFEWFLENKWMYNIDEISPEIQYENYINKLNKINDTKRYYFMTIAHRKHSKNKFDFNESNILKLKDFCQKFVGVTQENSRISSFLEAYNFPLKSAIYFVESGKDKAFPKLHSHFLLEFENNKNPNLGRCVRKIWNDYFTENKITEIDEYNNKPFTSCYLEDKLHYAINGYKDDHENFVDLKILGGFGKLWSMLSNLNV